MKLEKNDENEKNDIQSPLPPFAKTKISLAAIELDPAYTSPTRRANIYTVFLHNPFYIGESVDRSPSTRQFINIKPRVKNEIKQEI